MTELRQALAEIRAIRTQVARGTEFRGYGPKSIAVSGLLALGVAAFQSGAAAGSVHVCMDFLRAGSRSRLSRYFSRPGRR